jgi:hypothetical protein
MIEPGIVAGSGGQICVSVDEFAAAMAAAQGQIINSAGAAMISFFFIGVLVGAGIVALFWWGKSRIDEKEADEGDDE